MSLRRVFVFVIVIVLMLGAGLAWAKGGGARPALPGQGGGSPLDERRERTRRLQELQRAPAANFAPPTAPAPTTGPRREPPTPEPTAPGTSLVHLHHGSVRMVADLARVDLTLEVQNVGVVPMEWERRYAIDPAAELIGAVLKRVNEDPIQARTLSTEDATRVYASIRTPPPERTPGNRDPLLVSRERNDRLRIQIWPIEAQETVRVELTFVTPLRGEGARRTYVDVMGGPAHEVTPRRGRTEPEPEAERPRDGGTRAAPQADWLMQPGALVLSSAPAEGMQLCGAAGGRLHFTGPAATTPDHPAPRVSVLSQRRSAEAVLVGSGSYAGRIAAWRFDPRAYLVSKGFAIYDTLQLRLRPLDASCQRMAPDAFGARDEALPVTARVPSRTATEIAYRVDVLDRDGQLVAAFDESVPLVHQALDDDLEGAVSGWHRAQLVRRVLRWAHTDAGHQIEAQRFAVDMGVLVPGSSAIAIPAAEKRRLRAGLRRLYESDGVPLGAQQREADLKAPPRGSLR